MGNGVITIQDLKIALRSLGFETQKEEIKRLIAQESAGRGDGGPGSEKNMATVDYPDFLDIMTTKLGERDTDHEISKAFGLFSG